MNADNAPRIIAVANNKGGQAKTTTALVLSTLFAEGGSRVLLVDLDAQANATQAFNAHDESESIYYALAKNTPLPIKTVYSTAAGKIDLVPSSLQMEWLSLQMAHQIARERMLKNALSRHTKNYDVVILDCPPSLGIITQNAFVAATHVLIPMTADKFAATGLRMVLDFHNVISNELGLNPGLKILGVAITQFERNNLTRAYSEALTGAFAQYLFSTKIRRNVAVGKAHSMAMPLIEFDPDCAAVADYRELHKEIMCRLKLDK